jgi:hypothetical protein
MTAHVKHLGFELETKVIQITRALGWVPSAERAIVVQQLSPIGLRRAVAEQLDIKLDS